MKNGEEVILKTCEATVRDNSAVYSDGAGFHQCQIAADWLVNHSWSCDAHISEFLFLDRLSIVQMKADNPVLGNHYALAEIQITR
jgi:hypothetical protein